MTSASDSPVDHVCDSFGRGEGKFSVEKSALGKLPAPGCRRAESEGALQNTAGDILPAVTVKLHHVFARIAGRSLEIYAKSVIGKGSAVDFARIQAIGPKIFHRRLTRRNKHFFRYGKRAVPADSHDCHPPFSGRRGNCRYISFLHFCASLL